MDDRNINDLKYGHFGQPTYSLEDGTWLFGRRPGHDGQLRQLGSWKTAIASPVQQDDNFDIPSTAAITKEAKAISENRPELVPSLEFLPGEVLTSAAVISTVHFYDAAIGSLLSFGSTAVQGTYTYPQRVAAFASGNSGNILQLAVLSKLRSGWLDGSVSIEGPSFSNSTSGYWNQDAAPLQQVCFAQSDARSTFLAVRTLSRTNIFRPRLHSRGQPAQQSQFYTLPSSIVDPHFVLSISQEQTGGAPHADVTFNPEYQRQFGLIDQQGNWGIWDIDRRRDANRASEVFASCYVIGQVREETDTVCPQRRDDGWARITWIGDVNTIFVCSRRKAEVFNVRGGQPTPLQCPSVLSERSPDWILDVKIVPMNRHRLCVLTSTRLFLLAVTCQDDLVPTIDFARGMRVLLSWTHFRGTDDISLQLSVCSANENGTFYALHTQSYR
jgi:RNA polymerase I-specific transcription initiation factor RRN6